MAALNELNSKAASDEELAQWKESHNPGDAMPAEIKTAILNKLARENSQLELVVSKLRNSGVIK